MLAENSRDDYLVSRLTEANHREKSQRARYSGIGAGEARVLRWWGLL